MRTEEIIRNLNDKPPPAFETLGGDAVEFDPVQDCARLTFTAGRALCNPDDGLQGGFICGMLDAAMAIAVFCELGDFAIVATLEIKVSYLEIARPGELVATGRVVRKGKTITFLDGELRAADGKLLATATQTARVIRQGA